MKTLAQVKEKLDSLVAVINEGKAFKSDTFVQYRINTDDSISIYSTEYFYGGEGYQVKRGAWFNKNENEIFRGEPRKVVDAIYIFNQIINDKIKVG